MTDVKKIKCESCGYVQDVTGFGEVMPPCPECGDTSSWVRLNIPPVEISKEQAEAIDQATAQPKETGFEDIMPPAPEAGDVSSIARNSIPPVQDVPARVKAKQYRCESCGSKHEFDASIVVLPPCPDCDEEGNWVAINVTEFLTGQESQLQCDEDQAAELPKETGFEDLMPPAPEAGDISSIARSSIRPVDDGGAPKREPGEPNKETGFEDIMPAAPESGDMSTVALNSIRPVHDDGAPRREPGEPNKETGFEDVMPPAPEAGDVSTIAVNSIPPVKDEPVAKREKQEYKCDKCGETISAFGDELPPCPECGDLGSWTLANLGVRR